MESAGPSSLDNTPGYIRYDLEAEAQDMAPQRVWILAGGSSVERHASLASGLNIWHQLRKQRDIKVCAWVLSSAAVGCGSCVGSELKCHSRNGGALGLVRPGLLRK